MLNTRMTAVSGRPADGRRSSWTSCRHWTASDRTPRYRGWGNGGSQVRGQTKVRSERRRWSSLQEVYSTVRDVLLWCVEN